MIHSHHGSPGQVFDFTDQLKPSAELTSAPYLFCVALYASFLVKQIRGRRSVMGRRFQPVLYGAVELNEPDGPGGLPMVDMVGF